MNSLKVIYLNISFYLLFMIFSALAIPLCALGVTLLAFFSSRRTTVKRIRHLMAWYGLAIIQIIPFPLIKIQYRDYSGKDVPRPYIFICNHRSASDPFLVARPSLPHECIQVVNIWPFKIPVLGLLAKFAGYLSVNELPFEEFFKKTADLLKQGVSIIAFPEGTRSGQKAMQQFYSAIFRVALETKYPLVPVCICGNEHIPSRGSFLLRPGTIKIHKLPALQWKDYQALSPFLLKNRVRQIIAEELAIIEG